VFDRGRGVLVKVLPSGLKSHGFKSYPGATDNSYVLMPAYSETQEIVRSSKISNIAHHPVKFVQKELRKLNNTDWSAKIIIMKSTLKL
jgi:hypothetical protein